MSRFNMLSLKSCGTSMLRPPAKRTMKLGASASEPLFTTDSSIRPRDSQLSAPSSRISADRRRLHWYSVAGVTPTSSAASATLSPRLSCSKSTDSYQAASSSRLVGRLSVRDFNMPSKMTDRASSGKDRSAVPADAYPQGDLVSRARAQGASRSPAPASGPDLYCGPRRDGSRRGVWALGRQ